MRAYARSIRIAPKKLAVIAQMVRGMPVHEAMDLLSRTHKKGARLVEVLLKSAMANATHNAKQREDDLMVKTIVVNQAQSYRRGVPMARGRTRPMRKFLSHLEIVLGVMQSEGASEKKPKMPKMPKKPKKTRAESSQKSKVPVQSSHKMSTKTGKSSDSSDSSVSSSSSL